MKPSARMLCLSGALAAALCGSASSVLAQGAGEVVLYQVNFDGVQARGWQLEPGWRVIQDAGNYVLAGEGRQWARTDQSYPGDFRLQFRLKLVKGRIHLVYRLSQTSRYFIGFHQGGSDLNKQYFPDTFQNGLAGSGAFHSLAVWHDVEIAGEGNTLRFLIDGQVEWTYADPAPLLGASFAFETLDDSVAYVDDISVYGPPTPTPDARFTWVRTGGPLGGLGYDVRMRPDKPDLMYVTDAWAGVFTSTDSGQTWPPASEGITKGITFGGIGVDPRSSEIVYAAAEGSSWTWNGQPRNGREFDMVQGVVYKTTDGGQSWQAVWRGDNLARYVWIDPRNPDVIYVSTSVFDREAANSIPDSRTPGGVGILKSTDGGQTWTKMDSGLENLYVGTLFRHPANPDILLAVPGAIYVSGHDADLHRSLDGGETWERWTDFASVDDGDGVGDMGAAIAVDAAHPDNILFSRTDTWHNADAGYGLVESRDGGKTWMPLNAGLPHRSVSAVALASDGSLFAGTRCGESGVCRPPMGPDEMPVHLPLCMTACPVVDI